VDLELVRTDLARGLGRFDRIVANPPYLPTRPEERDPDRWQNLALDGGPDGCRVTGRLVEELERHLSPGGEAFVLVSSRQDPDALARIRSGWASHGGSVEVVAAEWVRSTGDLLVCAHRELEGERLEVWRLRLDRP
jgi:methylase of polypeptide subunit release factors